MFVLCEWKIADEEQLERPPQAAWESWLPLIYEEGRGEASDHDEDLDYRRTVET